jgi:hypothetical protein
MQGPKEVVEVMQREKTDEGVEAPAKLARRMKNVAAMQRDPVSAVVEGPEALEESLGEVEPFDDEAAVCEGEGVAAHPAPDVENAVSRSETGE